MAEENPLTTAEREHMDIVLSCVNALAISPKQSRGLVDSLTEGHDATVLLDAALGMLFAHFVILSGGRDGVIEATKMLREAIVDG